MTSYAARITTRHPTARLHVSQAVSLRLNDIKMGARPGNTVIAPPGSPTTRSPTSDRIVGQSKDQRIDPPGDRHSGESRRLSNLTRLRITATNDQPSCAEKSARLGTSSKQRFERAFILVGFRQSPSSFLEINAWVWLRSRPCQTIIAPRMIGGSGVQIGEGPIRERHNGGDGFPVGEVCLRICRSTQVVGRSRPSH